MTANLSPLVAGEPGRGRPGGEREARPVGGTIQFQHRGRTAGEAAGPA
jgi:hypothetical protein